MVRLVDYTSTVDCVEMCDRAVNTMPSSLPFSLFSKADSVQVMPLLCYSCEQVVGQYVLQPFFSEAPWLFVYTADSISHLADDSVVVVLWAHGGRRDVERAPPDLHLSLSVPGGCLGLVQASQASVVSLVESPGPVNRHPHLVNAIQNQPQCPDGPFQHRGVANVKLEAGIWERVTGM